MDFKNKELKIKYKKLTASDVSLLRSLNEVFAVAFEDSETHLSKKPIDSYLKDLLNKPHFITGFKKSTCSAKFTFAERKFFNENSLDT